MGQAAFTRAEVQARVGRRVHTRVASAGVPQGTIGTITGADRVTDGYDVEAAWGEPGRRTPWVD